MAKLPSDLHLVIVGRKTKYQKKLDTEIKTFRNWASAYTSYRVFLTTFSQLFIIKLRLSFILLAMKALVFQLSKPYKVDCQLWLLRVVVWKKRVVLIAFM